jgi:hypothetical protein
MSKNARNRPSDRLKERYNKYLSIRYLCKKEDGWQKKKPQSTAKLIGVTAKV